MYNLAEMRTRVKNRLDDEDFEDEYLDRALNYAQWEITNKNKLSFLETTDTLSLNPGDTSVPLPADYHEYHHLIITSPSDSRINITDRWTDYSDFVDTYIDPASNPVGQPYFWSEYGRQVVFGYPADQSYTLKLDYQRKASQLVDENDVPDIPEEFAELLELGAYMRIAKREDDYEVKAAEQRDYDSLLLDLKSVYGRKKGPGGKRRMRVA